MSYRMASQLRQVGDLNQAVGVGVIISVDVRRRQKRRRRPERRRWCYRRRRLFGNHYDRGGIKDGRNRRPRRISDPRR